MKLFGVSFGEHFHDISKVAGKISYKFTSPVVAQACILAGMPVPVSSAEKKNTLQFILFLAGILCYEDEKIIAVILILSLRLSTSDL